MPDRSHLDFLDDLASNVATLEASVLLEPPASSQARRDREVTVQNPVPRPRLFLGLTASVWLVLLTSISLAGFCLYKHHTQASTFKVITKPISQTELGANVPGVNPLEPDDLSFGTKVDPVTWRAVHLTGHQEDDTLVEIQVLRPLNWLTEHNVKIGNDVALDFGRIGVVGLLRVDSIHPCPTIRPGLGRTVTGIFRHHAYDVLTLVTENGEQIGLTPNHEIWSEDRREFVAASDLRPAETLRLFNGTTRVTEIIRRQSGEVVYTLEVQISHVFHVAKSGLLVHNCGTGIPSQLNVSGKQFGKKMAERARELGLDPGDPRVRYQMRSRIQRIFDNADEIRSGVFRGQGPNGAEGPVLFFRRGNDVVVTTINGDFVTLLTGGINNKRFIEGVLLP